MKNDLKDNSLCYEKVLWSKLQDHFEENQEPKRTDHDIFGNSNYQGVISKKSFDQIIKISSGNLGIFKEKAESLSSKFNLFFSQL